MEKTFCYNVTNAYGTTSFRSITAQGEFYGDLLNALWDKLKIQNIQWEFFLERMSSGHSIMFQRGGKIYTVFA